jgi:hypothetical protein
MPKLNAKLSTAINAIMMPADEFENFGIAVRVEYPDF